jgi:hypothetical protein
MDKKDFIIQSFLIRSMKLNKTMHNTAVSHNIGGRQSQ